MDALRWVELLLVLIVILIIYRVSMRRRSYRSTVIVSKTAIHSVGPKRDGYGPFLQTINAAGRQLAGVKCRDDFGAVDEPLSLWPNMLTIGARTIYDGNIQDTPQQLLDQILSMHNAKPVIQWFEMFNEVAGDWKLQADKYIALLPLLKPSGLGLVMFNCATGTPQYPEIDPVGYAEIARACKFARDNGYLAMLGLHEYVAENPADTPSRIGRYRKLADYLQQANALIPIVITEYNTELFPGDAAFMQHIRENDHIYSQDPRIVFCATWTLGGGGWAGANFQTALPALGDYLASVPPFAPIPPEPPTPGNESTGGDFAALPALLDASGHVWRLGTGRIDPGYPVLKDGAAFGGGYGVALLLNNHTPYVTNAFAEWYQITATGYTKLAGDPRLGAPPTPGDKKLAVPWVGQNTSLPTDDYSNSDCGPASTCMWLRFRGVNVTVDDVSRATGKPAGFTFTTFPDLDKAANVYGLDLAQRLGNFTLDLIRAEIDAGRPTIALVDYPALPKRWDQNYTASHWIIVFGYGAGKFFYHDPYWPDAAGGAAIEISDAQLTKALQDVTTDGNTAMQGIMQASAAPSPSEPVILGAHCRASAGDLPKVETDALTLVKPNVIGYKFLTGCSVSHYNAIKALGFDPSKCMTRLFFDIGGWPNRPTAQQFVDLMRAGISDAWAFGVRKYELLNEVNLYSEWRPTWGGASGFVVWALDVINLLRAAWPGIQIITPGLAPVGDMPGVAENTDTWIAAFQAGGLFGACEFTGVHAYWRDGPHMLTDQDGLNFHRYLGKTAKPLIITECANNQAVDADADKGRQYKQYRDYLRDHEPQVSAVYVYVLQSDTASDNNTRQTWVRGTGITDICRELAKVP